VNRGSLRAGRFHPLVSERAEQGPEHPGCRIAGADGATDGAGV